MATVATIVRDTAATLERVIVNELKKDTFPPPDNGKIRLSEPETSRSGTSPSSLDRSRRYPAQVSSSSQSLIVPSTTVAAAIYSQSASSLHLSSVSNFTTATTTTTTVTSSAPPPSSTSSSSVGPTPSSSSHWSNPVPNTIQVISRTTNAISPVAPGTKPPVVAVSGIVKSEDIKRTLPVTSEGVEGHKPKEREKESFHLPRPEPINIGSVEKEKYSEQVREQIKRDAEKKETISRDSDRGQETRERDSEGRPLASALKEPIQVYRDPNLTDTEVIHVNSVQHQLAYQHQHHQQRGAVADPSPTHSQLTAAAVAATQHSTLHPTSSALAAAGIGASPSSAFVPSAAVAGRIPSHHPLARHPMFTPHMQAAALYQQHSLAQAGHIPATAYPAHLAVINQHDLHTRQHLAGLMQQESMARLQHHPGVFAQLQHAATAAAALQGMHPGMSAAQLQQLWQQQQQQAGMPIPPTWILQQHHEELERHLHQQQQQQQQASEKSPSVGHAAVALNQSHHDKPRTQTPQPASASHAPRDVGSSSSSRESSVRHYAEFPPSDAQAAVQRHFQESLRKLQLPYTFSTSPAGGSGSITAGTAIPKTEPGQPKEQVDRQVSHNCPVFVRF